MQKLINGLVAKLMDEFMADIYEETENEARANWAYNYWLQEGVPDESDYQDCVSMYGEQENFNELRETFKYLLYHLDIEYDRFKNYASKNFFEEILQSLLKTLDITD